jgi:Ca2+-transporting ATPase
VADILGDLDVAVEGGLADDEVVRRRARYGANEIRSKPPRSALRIFAAQSDSLIVGLLAAATVAAFALGEVVEGAAIAAVLLINAGIGFATELQATRSVEALARLGHMLSTVRRNGRIVMVPAPELVPGDILLVQGGDVVSADVRIIEASRLQANEAALTGESVPADKRTESVPEDAPLAERASMLYKGTYVTRGAGVGVVTAIGMTTEVGEISRLVERAEPSATPLERRLLGLGHALLWLTLACAIALVISGVLGGRDLFLSIETAIALAVAAIPEGLPAVATIALARGVWRMAGRNALVRELAAVETLGSANLILTDKTGTLTENRMRVVRLALPGGDVRVPPDGSETTFLRDGRAVDPVHDRPLRNALLSGVLCNDAALPDGAQSDLSIPLGDPMEIALLEAGSRAGLDRPAVLAAMPEVREEAFDPEIKMMATFHEVDGDYRVAVKGAPDRVLCACTHVEADAGPRSLDDAERDAWRRRDQELAAQGLRVLALATKRESEATAEPYASLAFVGLVCLLDAPRTDIAEAIRACRQAGIRVVMATGDQAATALAIAGAVDIVQNGGRAALGSEIGEPSRLTPAERARLLGVEIFARTSPAQKLDLIQLYQEAGCVVAMIGDGVNDAPALRKADIGVAMGRRGTQVAREAAAMVLEDDRFGTIVAAVEEGRIIFDNIRRFATYLLSCNLSEILAVGLATVAGGPLPVLPLQILYLNLVTDVFPALALGVGKGSSEVLRRPPRDPREPILTRSHWLSIMGYGALITTSVLLGLGIARGELGMDPARALTVSFLILAFAQLGHVLNSADPASGAIRNEVTRNPWVWAAVALCTMLLLVALQVPLLSGALRLVDPGLQGWILIGALSPLPLVVGRLLSILHRSSDAD